jgi:spermidine/putrescine transport system permease protein
VAEPSLPGDIDRAVKKAPGRVDRLGLLLVAPGALWLFVFAVAPLLLLVLMSFWTSSIFGLSTEFTLDNYRALMRDPVYALVLLQTLRIAVMVTAISLLISYPVAHLLASVRLQRRTVLLLLLFVPFWSSYVVRTFVWLPMLGRSGLVNNVLVQRGVVDRPLEWLLYNEAATQIGLIYVYTLFMTLPIYLSLDRIDPKLIEAASDLGAGPFRSFLRITLPLSMPGVISGCIMVFLLTCGAYVTPQLLGGASGVMIGNIIAAQYTNTNNWALGAALSVMLILIVSLILAVFGRRVRLYDVFLKGSA